MCGKKLSRINIWQQLKSGVKFTTTAIASFIIGAIILSIHALLQGPETYKIYLIGQISDQGTHQTHEGFRESWRKISPLKINNIPIAIEVEDDTGDPEIGKRYAQKIAQQPDVLLVVGHGNSSTSKNSLKEYMAAKPKIPVILVTETNPALLPRLCEMSEVPCPILRLSPTDEDQAKTAIEFAMDKGAESFLVFKDKDNPVYSDYVAKRLAVEITQRNKRVCLTTTDEIVKIQIEMLKSLKIDCVIFVGAYTEAMIVVRWTNQIYRVNEDLCPRKPMIILTDWVGQAPLAEDEPK